MGGMKVELHYWEKQLILYTKGHFGCTDYKKDLKHFPAEMYGLSLQYTDDNNVMGMVVRLYQKLVDAGHIPFKLEKFIDDIFKRAYWNGYKSEVARNDILNQMLSEFANVAVLDDNKNKILDLGKADEGLKAVIKEKMENEMSKISDELVSYSGIFQCSLEKAWRKHLPEIYTKSMTFEEVKNYIDKKIELGSQISL